MKPRYKRRCSGWNVDSGSIDKHQAEKFSAPTDASRSKPGRIPLFSLKNLRGEHRVHLAHGGLVQLEQRMIHRTRMLRHLLRRHCAQART